MGRRIIQCSEEQLEELVQIAEKTFRDAFEAFNNPQDFQDYAEKAFHSNQILRELRQAGSSFYFLYDQGELVGYFKTNEYQAQTDIQDPEALELERIYVLPEHQGKGVRYVPRLQPGDQSPIGDLDDQDRYQSHRQQHSQYMLNAVKKQALEMGKRYLWLGVWKENRDAVRFYESFGYRIFGEHPYYVGQDRQMDWLMRLDLITLPKNPNT